MEALNKPLISYEEFTKVDIRCGIILEAKPFEGAHKPAYQLWIDFGGTIGIKKSSAQITVRYNCEELIGLQVIAVVNFKPRQIGKFMSEVLVLGLPDEHHNVVLLSPTLPVPIGGAMY